MKSKQKMQTLKLKKYETIEISTTIQNN